MYDATLLPDLQGQDGSPEPADTDGVANEPITLQRAKDHLRVVFDDENDYIQSLITAARVMAEGRLNRTLVQRQRVAVFSSLYGQLKLHAPPLVSIDDVTYIDTDGREQSLSSYDEYIHFTPAAIALPAGITAPQLRDRPDAVRVTYTAGYADGHVPASIQQWMLLVIGTLYENRETMAAGVQMYSMPEDFMSWMLQPYVVYE